MKELKINPRFEKFSPKKKQDEIDEDLFVKRVSLLSDFSVNSRGEKKVKDIANLIFNKYNKNKKKYQNNLLEEKKYFSWFSEVIRLAKLCKNPTRNHL